MWRKRLREIVEQARELRLKKNAILNPFHRHSWQRSFAFFSEMWHFLSVLLCNALLTAARCLSRG
jgi:hypothetical protein